jgi:uncharacterized membrane protein YeaQ/YmgE (transglycosylase-associated protein family)
MSILAWVVLGLVAGFLGSKIVNKRGEGLMLDIVLGVVGVDCRRTLVQRVWRARCKWLELLQLLCGGCGLSFVVGALSHCCPPGMTGRRINWNGRNRSRNA